MSCSRELIQGNLDGYIYKNLKKKLTSGTGGDIIKVLFIRVAGICSTYLTMYLILNYGQVRDWGWINLTISVINLVGIVTAFGLPTLILKKFPIGAPEDNARDVKAIFKIITIFSAIAIIILLPFKKMVLSNVFKVDTENIPFWQFFCFLILILVFNYQKVILSLLRLNKQMLLFGLFNNNNIYFFTLLLVTSCSVVFYDRVGTAIVMGTLLLLPFLVLTGASFFALKSYQGLWERNQVVEQERPRFQELLAEASPLVLSSSLMMIMNWSDTFMIGVFMGPEEVGYYNIIFKVSSIATIFLTVVNSVVTPKLSLLYQQDRKKLGRFVRKANKYIFLFTSVVLLAVVILSGKILGLFGEGLEFLELPLYVLIIGYFINAYCGTVGFLLQMTGYAGVFQRIVLVATVSNIILNLFLIPRYGLLGAAISGTISMSLWNLAGTYVVNKELKISTFFFIK